MKKIIPLFLLFFTFLIGCKNSSKETENKEEITAESTSKENPIPAKIAMANGFENFKDLNEIEFTFNVKVNDTLRSERSWKWFPKSHKIQLSEKRETITYTKDDSLSGKSLMADQKFINDSYWFLFPYQLMWSNYESTYSEKEIAPISNKEMQMLTINYKGKGGYSPDDSYRVYFGDDNMIQEWTYISSNGRELTTTWEDYETFNGISISKMHKSEDSTFQLYFTNIKMQ